MSPSLWKKSGVSVLVRNGAFVTVDFKYEKLGVFCHKGLELLPPIVGYRVLSLLPCHHILTVLLLLLLVKTPLLKVHAPLQVLMTVWLLSKHNSLPCDTMFCLQSAPNALLLFRYYGFKSAPGPSLGSWFTCFPIFKWIRWWCAWGKRLGFEEKKAYAGPSEWRIICCWWGMINFLIGSNVSCRGIFWMSNMGSKSCSSC